MAPIVLRGDAGSLCLPDSSVDLVVTSPPYFCQRSYTDGGEHYAGQIGSEDTPQQYVAGLLACTREWMRVLKSEGSLFVNLGDKYSDCKSLLGLPWRYAIGCVDDLGLILRAEIIWAKPNGMPESVTDRVRRAHEQVFHFTKQPRYYAAVDEIREDYTDNRQCTDTRDQTYADGLDRRGRMPYSSGPTGYPKNPLGKLPGSVWDIPSQPLTVPDRIGVDHFAAFPTELPRRCILGWSPPGGLVLDPFGGTGTTALVASVLGRTGITVDRSADYCRLAKWRTTNPGERCRVIGAPKPPPVIDGQVPLFA